MQSGKVLETYSGKLHDVQVDQAADKVWVDGRPVVRMRAVESEENEKEGVGAFGREDPSIPPPTKIVFHFKMADLRALPEG